MMVVVFLIVVVLLFIDVLCCDLLCVVVFVWSCVCVWMIGVDMVVDGGEEGVSDVWMVDEDVWEGLFEMIVMLCWVVWDVKVGESGWVVDVLWWVLMLLKEVLLREMFLDVWFVVCGKIVN